MAIEGNGLLIGTWISFHIDTQWLVLISRMNGQEFLSPVTPSYHTDRAKYEVSMATQDSDYAYL
jgi:hypothetical protein